MVVVARLAQLPSMHPRLLWGDIAAAAAIVLGDSRSRPPWSISIDMNDVPGFRQRRMDLLVDPEGLVRSRLARIRRTYDSMRLVELASIAVAGLALYHGGAHEIRDVARRGSGADYLVNETGSLLEVAGRSRRQDLHAAWEERVGRLKRRGESSFLVCVVEFETPAGRLGYFD